MTEIEARILKESEYSLWDDLVERSKGGTIFHSSKWIAICSKTLNIKSVIIGVFKGYQLIGGCSFYIDELIYFFKIGYTNIPLTPYGGFVISTTESRQVRESEKREKEIIILILEKIKTLKLDKLNITNSPDIIDIRPFKGKYWGVDISYTYILSLDNDIFSSISKKVRGTIRKAQKNGIDVKIEYNPEIYWKLTQLTYEKQDMKIPFQKQYTFNLMNMLLQNNQGKMWLARAPTGDVISGLFVIYDSHIAHAWIMATDPKFVDTGVASLIFFESFLDLQKMGFHKIILMGGNISHIGKFISSFNPDLVPYYTIQKSHGIFRIFNAMELMIR